MSMNNSKKHIKMFKLMKLPCRSQSQCYPCLKHTVFSKKTFTIKTSQIKALRTKYEALLLEDKKRKERNEYILEKIDKMRTSTTLLQADSESNNQTHASYFLPTSNSCYSQARASDCNTQLYRRFYHRSPDANAHVNITSILSDIYKNFILIPKILSSRQKDLVQVDTTDNNDTDANMDWKSKYDILNKLKQEEKEDIGNDRVHFEKPRNQHDDYIDRKIPDQNAEIAGKDILIKKHLTDKHIENVLCNKDFFKEHTMNLVHNTGNTLNNRHETDAIDSVEKKISFNNNEPPIEPTDKNQYPFSKIEGNEKTEQLDDDGINPVQISYDAEDIGKPLGEVPTNTDDVQYPIEVINVDDFTPENQVNVQDGVNVNPKGYTPVHFDQYSKNSNPSGQAIPGDGVNNSINQELLKTISSQKTVLDPPPISEQDRLYQQGNNDNILALENNSYEPVITDDTVAELSLNAIQTDPDSEYGTNFGDGTEQNENAYESEKQELFYREPVSEIQYDQSTVGDTWGSTTNETAGQYPHEEQDQQAPDSEYGTNFGDRTEQNENAYESEKQELFYREPVSEIQYDQSTVGDTWGSTTNETAGQYLHEEQDQQAPVFISEHEETSTPYDQNYEQQYMVNYEQEYSDVQQDFNQAPEYEQYEQQVADQAVYNQEDQYNPETGYSQLQYEQENYDTVQQVEEQLNQYEGYDVVAQKAENQGVQNA